PASCPGRPFNCGTPRLPSSGSNTASRPRRSSSAIPARTSPKFTRSATLQRLDRSSRRSVDRSGTGQRIPFVRKPLSQERIQTMRTHRQTPETEVVIHELLENWETGGYFEDCDTIEELATELKKDFEQESWHNVEYSDFLMGSFIRCA